jgi:hypothetical protein
VVVLRYLPKGAKARLQAWQFERRRRPRQPVDWQGAYAFGEDCGGYTGNCRVVDLAEHGAGIEVFGAAPESPIGCRLAVNAPCPGLSMKLGLKGIVRNIGAGSLGGVQLGVEFNEFSADVFFLILSQEEDDSTAY